MADIRGDLGHGRNAGASTRDRCNSSHPSLFSYLQRFNQKRRIHYLRLIFNLNCAEKLPLQNQGVCEITSPRQQESQLGRMVRRN